MIRPNKITLKEFDVLYKPDTNFASHARLLQSKWRVKNGWLKNEVKKSNYGNFVETEFAKSHKVNFMTDNIKKLVGEKIIEIRKNGGLISEPRIWNNLLSSQPLCFNLFGELHYDLDLATRFFKELFPEIITTVTKVDFEYSTKRKNPDNSAFDVYVEYLNKNRKCFFGIEVKYQECLFEESPAKANENFENHKVDYIRLTESSGFFKLDSIDQLKLVPSAQIWRDHLLAYNMSDQNITGSFIYLFPFENDECRNGVLEYQKLLRFEDEEETRFYPRDLGLFIRTINKIHDTKWTRELKERYLGE